MKHLLSATGSATTLAALLSASCAFTSESPSGSAGEPSSKDHYEVQEASYEKVMNGPLTNRDWWPNQLDLSVLHQNSTEANPMGAGFDYASEAATVDLAALKRDIKEVMNTSQDWWPADWGTYGPLFIRMAWHSAGTYRVGDGRGGSSDGTQRFAPLNSWPDNANLDKARRLLWPVKQKYGHKVSWADIMILAGNCALEDAGFEPFGFALGREDVWEPQNDIYWGPEGEWLADARYKGDRDLEEPLAAVQMGLIYVNPQGPNGKPDPMAAAQDIRETFGRMAMNDEETVALIAGGHTLGKAHGAASPEGVVGPDPEAAPLEEQGFGWKNDHGKGNAEDTITSGLEGAWTRTPTRWSQGYLANLFEYEWELQKSPAGAWQWHPKDGQGAPTAPDAHLKGKRQKLMMLTTDVALVTDPAYRAISERFYENPEQFNDAFARAWYKLTHRDMGPVACLVGPEVAPAQLWQDPVPVVDHPLVDGDDVASLKREVLASGLTTTELVETAWASASTFRGSDKRGGANGGRVRLAPQNRWRVNDPEQLGRVLEALGGIQERFNGAQADATRISMADMIVLAGCAAVEKAAADAGQAVEVPFLPGRTDATQELTDVSSFAVLEPTADGFRNYVYGPHHGRPEEMLVDRAQLLSLSAPEMTVLVAGLRVLDANTGSSKVGVFTERPGVLSNDYFTNLLDIGTVWKRAGEDNLFTGHDRTTGEERWQASSVDLAIGSNSQLRAIAEVYASADAERLFVEDFVAAWTKVMNLDRFDALGANLTGTQPAFSMRR